MIELLYFMKSWCYECNCQTRLLDDLDYTVTKLDAYGCEAQDYDIKKIPTIVILKDGAELGRIVGLKLISTIERKINELT